MELVESTGFSLARECFWYNPAKMPMPAEWVTVRRIRPRDSVEYVWWLGKTPWPKANNRKVLKPYGKDMERLNRKGVRATVRPSGHNIKSSFSGVDAGGSIPPNVLEDELPVEILKFGNNAANELLHEAVQGIRPEDSPRAIPGGSSRVLFQASHRAR